MHLPGPLRWLSLVGSLTLAAPPGAMAVQSIASGDLAVGAAFLAVAVVAFAIPEYVQRRLPGPVTAVKRRLPYVGSGGEE